MSKKRAFDTIETEKQLAEELVGYKRFTTETVAKAKALFKLQSFFASKKPLVAADNVAGRILHIMNDREDYEDNVRQVLDSVAAHKLPFCTWLVERGYDTLEREDDCFCSPGGQTFLLLCRYLRLTKAVSAALTDAIVRGEDVDELFRELSKDAFFTTK